MTYNLTGEMQKFTIHPEYQYIPVTDLTLVSDHYIAPRHISRLLQQFSLEPNNLGTTGFTGIVLCWYIGLDS